MCGIFGYYTFGTPKELQAILDVIFTGLKRLEYRGYDSSGLCVDSSEAPTRVSTDGSRRASCDGGSSPFASSNGTPGAALEAALNSEGGCPDGAEPVIIKCPGKIENLEKMTEQYVKDHVSALCLCVKDHLELPGSSCQHAWMQICIVQFRQDGATDGSQSSLAPTSLQ
jgi:hypothetical protein